jgi:hypothetical protein
LLATRDAASDEEAAQRTADLREAGFRSDPVRLYHDEHQTFIELVRAMHRGDVDAAAVAPVLARIGVDVADLQLSAPANPEFHSDVVGYDVTITWEGADVPASCVRWTWSDGHIDEWSSHEPLRHRFVQLAGEAWCRCDVTIAEGHWEETAHWMLPDDLTEPPGDGGVPTAANTKAEIVGWLLDHGVNLTEPALMNLSKGELLDLVTDLLDTD